MAAPKRQKRNNEVMTMFQNLSGTVWNTLMRKELEVSLLIITR